MHYMQQKQFAYGSTRLPYYQTGEKPQLLFHAGTHGDEFEVIESATIALKRLEKILPPFLYIPYFSPSAIRRRNRLNEDNIDLNRHFFEKTPIYEAKVITQFLKKSSFDIGISLHEDKDQKAFYLYDSGYLLHDPRLEKLRQVVTQNSIELFCGVDDSEDSALGHLFVDGYGYFPNSEKVNTHGMFAEWAIKANVIKYSLTLEIPGKINAKQKNSLVYDILKVLFVN